MFVIAKYVPQQRKLLDSQYHLTIVEVNDKNTSLKTYSLHLPSETFAHGFTHHLISISRLDGHWFNMS
jgi:hypothetical protein